MRIRLMLCVAAVALCTPTVSAQTFSLSSWQAPYSVYSGYGTPYSYGNQSVKKFLIDDWLGYGYTRYSAPYYGRTPNPSSVYAPAWPALFGPHCPLWFPFRPCYSLLGAKPWPYRPYAGYGGMNSGPYYGNACAPQCPPPACVPQNYCPQPVCPPRPVCPPVAVRVPVTVCRPVTVDAGYYQQVWVSRPKTVMVPETRWQTQWVRPGQMMQPQALPGNAGCSGPGCQPSSSGTMMPGSSATPYPDAAFSPPTSHVPQTSSYSGVHTHNLPVAGISGDIYGDHESVTMPRTAQQFPVVPNAFSGTAPIVTANSASRYSVTTQPRRRYSAVVR